MTSAKDLRVAPIARDAADRFVIATHYSGRVCPNSQLNLGVFLGRGEGGGTKLEGVMQFGPSMDKRRMVGLVRDTPWNGFIELNRLAFSERLPRNSESRALGVALRMMRKQYPQLQWVVSFADGTQCGDGTIYRASGFVLTAVKRSHQIVELPDGTRISKLTLTNNSRFETAERYGIKLGGSPSVQPWLDAGARIVPGFMLRYVFFLDPTARARLTCPVLPFSAIDEAGAAMYKGVARGKQATPGDQLGSDGAAPIPTLHNDDDAA